MKLRNCRYSLEGLRCLLLGSAVISEEKFRTWRKHYEKALSDLAEIDKKKNGEVNDIGNKHSLPLICGHCTTSRCYHFIILNYFV